MAGVGCGDSSERAGTVKGRGVALDQVTLGLAIDSVLAIKGTYGTNCTDRTGSWAIPLNGYQLVGDETELSVVQSDDVCTLDVTEVKAGSTDAPLSYRPASPFRLTAVYAAVGVAFVLDGATATTAYANFRITPDITFETDFVVEMVYSDDIIMTDISVVTGFIIMSAIATAEGLAAPNTTISVSEFQVRTNSKNMVVTSTGSARLTQGSVVAESYVVDFDTLDVPPSYATTDAAFSSYVPVVLEGPSWNIQADEFDLVGENLTNAVIRNVIVSNIENGVHSYQIFQITIRR
jgi:hypothetical protein